MKFGAQQPRRERPFGILPCIDGYDVIALDTGRPVAHKDSAQSANGTAFRLNNAAQAGPKALAAALGARENKD
jgi:hypothetical protein